MKITIVKRGEGTESQADFFFDDVLIVQSVDYRSTINSQLKAVLVALLPGEPRPLSVGHDGKMELR